MNTDPKTPAKPGSRENLGLTDQDEPLEHERDDRHVEEKGEPFDGNFA